MNPGVGAGGDDSGRGTLSVRVQRTFLALIFLQGLHSIEEYYGRLYEVFPPARMISGLISSDLERGFIIFNVALVLFGFWCFLWPMRSGWRAAGAFAWLWVGIELINGIGHPIWAVAAGHYRPGVATALPLLVLALSLAWQLRSRRGAAVGFAR